MEKLIKENLVYLLFAFFVLFGGVYAAFHFGSTTYDSYSNMVTKKAEIQTKEQKLAQLKASRLPSGKKNSVAKSGKVIFEVPMAQFSPEASFGIMFENIIANIANTGVRVRSIDYNYKLAEDKILGANVEGYNACELSFTTVGSYTQLQNFFKNITKEKYLSSLYEVYIEPYDNDKTILIAKFKIRLYTKSV